MQDKRVKELLDFIETAELYKLLNDLDKGGKVFKKLIEKKLEERNLKHNKLCSNCTGIINPYSTNNYTLIFGPDDFRKKATFCALDCLEYFLNSLKQLKRG